MVSPTGNTRKLSYPLLFTEDMESVVGSEVTPIQTLENWQTTDSDERVDIVLNLSLNEYIALANSIDVGRDIAYGDNSIYIWWIWVRSLQSMSICESIVNCIENSIDVQNAIQLAVGGDPDINGNPLKWQQVAIEPVAGCDLDTTWGYSKALWNYINQQNVDFLEWLDEATNAGEQISRIMSGIPLFGLLPFDEIGDWLASLGEYNLDAYNSSITTAVNEQIWCDLFCLAQANNCSLTFEQIWEYFLGKFGGANFPTLGATFVELTTYMVTGAYLNDRIVYLWTLIQLGVSFIGGRFVGVTNMNQYAVHAQNGDPDNDWVTLCDPCACTEVTETYDFLVSDRTDVWTKRSSQPQSVWVSGTGWVSYPPGGLQLWTTRYSKITEVTMVLTSDVSPPVGSIYGYVESTNTASPLYGTLPFNGSVDLTDALLIVGLGGTGWTTVTVESVTIKGCLA